jgi:uncharacterized protein YceK
MQKSIVAIVCVAFLTLVLSGCGFIIFYPNECKNETPITSARDIFWSMDEIPKVYKTPIVYNKADFLEEWGKPNIINSKTENTETWLYQRKLWCGFVPILILPVPLLLPVCDGFERIEFQGNDAKNLHIRRLGAWVYLFFPPSHKAEPDCRHPHPLQPNQSKESNKESLTQNPP